MSKRRQRAAGRNTAPHLLDLPTELLSSILLLLDGPELVSFGSCCSALAQACLEGLPALKLRLGKQRSQPIAWQRIIPALARRTTPLSLAIEARSQGELSVMINAFRQLKSQAVRVVVLVGLPSWRLAGSEALHAAFPCLTELIFDGCQIPLPMLPSLVSGGKTLQHLRLSTSSVVKSGRVSNLRVHQQWAAAFQGSRLSMLNISLPRSSMFSTLQPLGDTLVALILHAPRSQLSMSRTLLAALTGLRRLRFLELMPGGLEPGLGDHWGDEDEDDDEEQWAERILSDTTLSFLQTLLPAMPDLRSLGAPHLTVMGQEEMDALIHSKLRRFVVHSVRGLSESRVTTPVTWEDVTIGCVTCCGLDLLGGVDLLPLGGATSLRLGRVRVRAHELPGFGTGAVDTSRLAAAVRNITGHGQSHLLVLDCLSITLQEGHEQQQGVPHAAAMPAFPAAAGGPQAVDMPVAAAGGAGQQGPGVASGAQAPTGAPLQGETSPAAAPALVSPTSTSAAAARVLQDEVTVLTCLASGLCPGPPAREEAGVGQGKSHARVVHELQLRGGKRLGGDHLAALAPLGGAAVSQLQVSRSCLDGRSFWSSLGSALPGLQGVELVMTPVAVGSLPSVRAWMEGTARSRGTGIAELRLTVTSELYAQAPRWLVAFKQRAGWGAQPGLQAHVLVSKDAPTPAYLVESDEEEEDWEEEALDPVLYEGGGTGFFCEGCGEFHAYE